MSADTTVVIAAYDFGSERRWTAEVVQAVENLYEEDSTAVQTAKSLFLRRGQPWFRTLPRAKALAALLAEDLREVGGLEYEDRPVILITDDEVVRLSYRKGQPLRH